jgi:hypothetical protein
VRTGGACPCWDEGTASTPRDARRTRSGTCGTGQFADDDQPVFVSCHDCHRAFVVAGRLMPEDPRAPAVAGILVACGRRLRAVVPVATAPSGQHAADESGTRGGGPGDADLGPDRGR